MISLFAINILAQFAWPGDATDGPKAAAAHAIVVACMPCIKVPMIQFLVL